MNNKPLWCASLSNGETLYEGKGDYVVIPGELSPWQRLLLHIGDTGSSITSLSLYTDGGLRWNLPSAGKNPKFKEFQDVKKPFSYRMYRKYGMDAQGPNAGREDKYTVIRADYPDGSAIETWVCENTLASWAVAI